jgi:hypothetical protein
MDVAAIAKEGRIAHLYAIAGPRTAGYGTCSPPDNDGTPTRCDPRS